jgi:hypothetical protein
MNKRRLLRLATFLEKLPRKRFKYTHWVGDDWGGAADLNCGTTACALGWATTIPSLRRAGLRLVQDTDIQFSGCGYVTLARPTKGVRAAIARDDFPSLAAAAHVFEITEEEAKLLFIPWSCLLPEASSAPRYDATPKQVARHIRKFVERERMPS